VIVRGALRRVIFSPLGAPWDDVLKGGARGSEGAEILAHLHAWAIVVVGRWGSPHPPVYEGMGSPDTRVVSTYPVLCLPWRIGCTSDLCPGA